MTDLKLLATQALADSEAATPGPWIADRSPAGYSNVLLEPGTIIMSGDADSRCWPDAAFIASARTALPTLARGYLELSEALEERECDMHARIRAGYDKTVADAWRAEVAKLTAALREALEIAHEGWGYAPDYFRYKWMDLERLAELAKLVGVTP